MSTTQEMDSFFQQQQFKRCICIHVLAFSGTLCDQWIASIRLVQCPFRSSGQARKEKAPIHKADATLRQYGSTSVKVLPLRTTSASYSTAVSIT